MDIAEYATSEPTVLAVGEGAGEWVATRLGESDAVRAVPDRTAALDVLEERGTDAGLLTEGEAVDCVVVGDGPGDRAGLDTVAAMRERDPDLPVVYAPADGEGASAAAATARGATRYLPRGAPSTPDLPGVVDSLVETFDRHRQLRRERRMFRAFLSTTPQSVYVKDDRARLVCVSDAIDESVDERLIGKTDLDLYAEKDEKTVRAAYEDDLRVIETGEPIVDKEERYELDNGETLWNRTSKFPWREDGEVVGLVGQTSDVTDQKRREVELEQEKRRMEQFASFASHDLRNPLMVATGRLEYAIETGDEESLETALDALERMERLIDDLLNIVSPDADDEMEWIALAAVTERAWEAVDAPAATLSVAVPRDLQVRAASGALRQLMENLLANAVEHAGPEVSVTVGLTDTGFYVADDGPGVPEDRRGSVFEHGFTTGGTGVGLALAAEIAETHGWEPRLVESETGGARFEFDRCLRRSAETPPPAEGSTVDLAESVRVGDLDVAGTITHHGDGAWTVEGGGRAVWGDIEEYTAAVGTVDGDCRIEARVTGVAEIHDYSKAGVFVVDAPEAGRPLGFAGATAVQGHETAWRTDDGEPVETRKIDDGVVTPHWYRIDRVGDRLTCFASGDGDEWRMIDQNVVDVSGAVAAGILVNSHEVGTTCRATFEDVRLVELDADG